MKLFIKEFKVPVHMVAVHKEVDLSNDNHLVVKKEIELTQEDLDDMNHKITTESQEIARFNKMQLDLATTDPSIKEVIKKVICKEDDENKETSKQ